jgi:subtilisin family serine protease
MSVMTRRLSSAALTGAVTLVAGSALAGNLFGSLGTTASGYPTWDSDVINIEAVSQTGAGVYVAVLDTGLVPHWRDYFPEARVAAHLGKGFYQPVSFKAKKDVCGLGVTVGKLQESTWVGSKGSTHGTHVTSTILGYSYRSNSDAAGGYPLPPIMVRGIAPDVTIIPVRVLADYQVPALPACEGGIAAQNAVFGTDEMIAAGINYVTDLAIAGYRPMVINMSLGGSELDPTEQAALDRAIANGVIVVASASNDGELGMDYPGAYAPVISVGSVGWVREWLRPDATSINLANRYRMWWLQYPDAPLLPGTAEVPDPTSVDDLYVSDFSSRELPGEELDVLAPGSWVRGPFAGDPGFNHLPWWSKGIGDLVGGNAGNFYYVGGTSMASPHVAALAAMMLEKNPSLLQSDVEKILKETALAMPSSGSRTILDNTVPATVTWDTDCGGTACDPVGSGVVRADAALGATP